MSNKIYPIGIQNFEKIRQESATFWKESADLYFGSIFSREEGTVYGTDGGEARKRLDRTSNFAS